MEEPTSVFSFFNIGAGGGERAEQGRGHAAAFERKLLELLKNYSAVSPSSPSHFP